MTGTIRTLRVDKGFGFIKDDAGKDISFTRAPCMAKGSTICAKATASSSMSARDRKARGRRTSGGLQPNHGGDAVQHPFKLARNG